MAVDTTPVIGNYYFRSVNITETAHVKPETARRAPTARACATHRLRSRFRRLQTDNLT